ncbi:MAG: nickel pincer cofactor biosynthesis protein LarB [Streptosporangiaceae bacterium]
MTGDAQHPADSPTAAGLAGIADLDVDRRRRTGVPEVVYGQGKSADQVVALLRELRRAEPSCPALATRCPTQVLGGAPGYFPGDQVAVDDVARTVVVGPVPAPRGLVTILTAGTTDLPAARECQVTLGLLGVGAEIIPDVGVAGLHRLLSKLDRIRAADCLVVAAGMDGALPGVVAGLVRAPVVGLPTSVGYGVASGGIAAAMTMLSSCSPGMAIVNIDNGFGAAVHAAKIIGVRRD